MYPNSLQIFYFCFIHGNERKIKAMLPYVILGKTDIKLLLGNSGNNEENNCKSDHNRSELLFDWLVKYK
jgi:hypothetical protein